MPERERSMTPDTHGPRLAPGAHLPEGMGPLAPATRRSFFGVLVGSISAVVGAIMAVPLVRFALHPVLHPAGGAEWFALGSQDELAAAAAGGPVRAEATSAAASAPAALSPDAAKGALLFESEGCSGCHGAQGHGGGGLFALANLGKRFPPEQLTALLHAPRADMQAGGMQAVQLKPEDMKALVAFLLSPQRDTAPAAP